MYIEKHEAQDISPNTQVFICILLYISLSEKPSVLLCIPLRSYANVEAILYVTILFIFQTYTITFGQHIRAGRIYFPFPALREWNKFQPNSLVHIQSTVISGCIHSFDYYREAVFVVLLEVR